MTPREARAWAGVYAFSLAFWAGVIYAAVTWPHVARLVAIFAGALVLGALLAFWLYTAGYRAGQRWNEVEVLHLRGQRDRLRREVHDALGQVDDAMAEVAASWRREEMRRG